MPLIPLPWLSDHVDLGGRTGEEVAAALVRVGLEEEAIHTSGARGPVVVGQVLSMSPETHKNGKTIEWCQVDVGPVHGVVVDDGGPPVGPRGVVCGAHNFTPGDKVVVALAGSVLPGDFAITARKTYGHISDGMICSERELGLGEDHDGIIVLSRMGLDGPVGSDALALLGLDEETVEVNVTPDRGYCFSVRGVAREFSHSTGAAFADPALVSTPPPTSGGFLIEVDDDGPIRGQIGCDRFVARIVRGCRAYGPSPRWMQRRLTQAGMRPISLGVDVTNYVMLELGQPIHAYDLDQVCAPIVVRRARAGEHLVTLDDVDRALDPEDLLICDSPDGERAGRVLGMAGVMGGASSEVTATTSDLLVEAAHFDPVSVARTSRRHRLSSESAKRFERGVDPELPSKAAQRVVDLLIEHGGGVCDAEVTDFDVRTPVSGIEFDPGLANRVVGVDYAPARVREVLVEIGCSVETGASTWTVHPPSWRPDLTRGIDLVEEVARIAGYDEIGSVVARGSRGSGLTGEQRMRRAACLALAHYGLVEVLSYPFVSLGVFDALGLSGEDPRRDALVLANPLDSTAPLMRTEILQTLLEVARRNVGRGFGDFGIFEVGQITSPGSRPAAGVPGVAARPTDAELSALHAAVPHQPVHAAGVLVGERTPASVHGPGRQADWADAVEAVRAIVRVIHGTVEARPVARAPWHPGRCAELVLRIGGVGEPTVIGWAGELHPAVVTAFALPERAAAFEVNLDAVLAAGGDVLAHAPFSTHPVAKEDLALVVPAGVPAAAVAAAVRAGAGEFAESVEVFDVYAGDQIGEGMKSVAVALRMRAHDRTLSAADVAAARARAITEAERAVGAVLRS
ncbi:MAG: phenylalanine--tRNA ligase subunit beta [Micrococcales bacterium]|nr:phenylalanine--tRNA ligase subunit beta [Micrococcales bacterium]